MKTTTRYKLLIAFTLIFLLTLIGFNISSGHRMNANIKEVDEENGVAAEQIEIIESKYPGLHLETITASNDTYIYAINSIKTDSLDLTKNIEQWIEKSKEQFISDAQSNSIVGHTAALNINLKTIPIADGIYNLIFSKYGITGGANGNNEIKVFTVNVKEDRLYQLTDFIEETDENRTELIQIILEQLNENTELQALVMEDELVESLASFDDVTWSITEEALILYWDEYEIAAGSAGIIQLTLPIEKIQHLVSDRKHELLHLDFTLTNEEADVIKVPERKPLDPDGKYVALTFDDGPHKTNTERVLNSLKEFDVKATFFMLGNQVDYYPSLVQRVAKEGHEIGNHSNTHPDLSKVDANRVQKEFETTNQRIYDVIGRYPTVFRPPYGSYNNNIITQATNLNLPIIMWSVDSLDWKTKNATSISHEILSTTTNGSIILMHDIHDATADALPSVLKNLKEQGYSFVTVSQLLEWSGDTGIGPHYGNYK